MVNVICKSCGGRFETLLSRIKIGRGKYCSRKCMGKWYNENLNGAKSHSWRGGPISVVCLNCKNKFQVQLCRKNTVKFCSPQCRGVWAKENLTGENSPLFGKARLDLRGKNNYRWKGGVTTKNCLICNKTFKARAARRDTAKFCSQKCCGKWFHENNILAGEKSHLWRGGKMANYPEMEKIRKSPKYKQWAKDIKERDDFTCQICNIRGGILRSNHIKRFADYPELRLDLSNGITICEGCDIKFVFNHEEDCEDFFNFNLIERGIIYA